MSDMIYISVDGALALSNKFALTDRDGEFLFTPPSLGRFPRPVRQYFGVQDWSVLNRSGGSAVCGMGTHFDPTTWFAGSWSVTGSIYTDNTAAAQGGGSFLMEDNTPGDGHLIACSDLFNAVGYNVSVLGTASPTVTRVMEYSQTGGAWALLPASYVAAPTGTNGWFQGERVILFPIPDDWRPMTALHGTGVPPGSYGLRVRTTAGMNTGAAAQAAQITVGRMYKVNPAIANNGVLSPTFEVEDVWMGAHLAFVVTQDTATANVANATGSLGSAKVRLRG